MNERFFKKEETDLHALLRFSLPVMVGIATSSLYNIVDRIFIGQILGSEGLAAVSVVFPFFLTVTSMGILIGVGSSSQVSRNLGEELFERAGRVIGNGFLYVTLFSMMITMATSFFLDDLIAFGGVIPVLVPLTRSYLSVVIWGAPFLLISLFCNPLIRAQGYPGYAMWSPVIGSSFNVILDWVFIFKLRLGLSGAAWATVISQFLAAMWGLSFYLFNLGELKFIRSYFYPDGSILKETVRVGLSPCLMEFSFAVIVTIGNRALGRAGGDIAISAMAIFFTLNTLVYIPVMGIGQGAQPLIGYNYGAGNLSRMTDLINLSMSLTAGFLFVFLVLIQLFPEHIVMVFNRSNSELISAASRALKIGYMAIPMGGIAIITSFVFQALGKSNESIFLNLSRQVFIFIPSLVFLPRFLGIDGVWVACLLTDLGGGLLGWIMMRTQKKEWKRSSMESNQAALVISDDSTP